MGRIGAPLSGKNADDVSVADMFLATYPAPTMDFLHNEREKKL